uniref:hypothetical protein n=1 Tax=Helicobacter vulpis TaxID=2316076 RepID=UPI0013CDE329
MSGIALKDFVLELGRTDVKIVIKEAKEIGLDLKPTSSLDEETAVRLYDFITNKLNARMPKRTKKPPAPSKAETPPKPTPPNPSVSQEQS